MNMRKLFIAGVSAGIALSVFLGPVIGAGRAFAAVGDWQKGATIYPRWNTDFSSASFQQSIQNLAATHANYVTLHIPLHQSNIYSTDVAIGGDAPTDQSLVDGITFIHSQGMHVALKFQLLPNDGNWSAYINPSDRASWFANYGNVIAHYAQIAQANGVEEMVIGEELIDMTSDNLNSSNTANWFALIGRIRGIYSGKLTYSANWGGDDFTNEKAHVKFWSALDQIGISAYFNLYGDNSVGNLTNQWNNWNISDIQPLANQWGKPVLFTEIGYKSIWNANQNPWNWQLGGSPDMQAQANDYEALFEYWNNYPFMQGVYLWNWSSDPNAGGAGNNDYTPQNKTAQSTMTTWFGQAGSGGGGGGTGGGGTPGGAFTANATANPGNPATGQTTVLSVDVTDTGAAAAGDLVDIEIYNSSGAKSFQQIFGNETFAANQTKTYSTNWTPGAADAYTLKVGVFNGDWTQNYYWGDRILAINAGTGSMGGGGIVSVWWPTDGSTVSGVQPFKAIVTNTALSAYSMFWQVDGGVLNGMYDVNDAAPHKEAQVDVSPWNWHGAGPYAVNFIAKDSTGNVIGQSTSHITVAH